MRRLLLAALGLAFVPSLHAQLVEVYGSLSDIHTTNVPVTIYPPCPVGLDTCGPLETGNSTDSFAAGGGVTLNVIRLPFVKPGSGPSRLEACRFVRKRYGHGRAQN